MVFQDDLNQSNDTIDTLCAQQCYGPIPLFDINTTVPRPLPETTFTGAVPDPTIMIQSLPSKAMYPGLTPCAGIMRHRMGLLSDFIANEKSCFQTSAVPGDSVPQSVLPHRQWPAIQLLTSWSTQCPPVPAQPVPYMQRSIGTRVAVHSALSARAGQEVNTANILFPTSICERSSTNQACTPLRGFPARLRALQYQIGDVVCPHDSTTVADISPTSTLTVYDHMNLVKR